LGSGWGRGKVIKNIGLRNTSHLLGDQRVKRNSSVRIKANEGRTGQEKNPSHKQRNLKKKY